MKSVLMSALVQKVKMLNESESHFWVLFCICFKTKGENQSDLCTLVRKRGKRDSGTAFEMAEVL